MGIYKNFTKVKTERIYNLPGYESPVQSATKQQNLFSMTKKVSCHLHSYAINSGHLDVIPNKPLHSLLLQISLQDLFYHSTSPITEWFFCLFLINHMFIS